MDDIAGEHVLSSKAGAPDATPSEDSGKDGLGSVRREADEPYELLSELVGEAVYVQRRGRFISGNSSAVQLFGAANAADLAGRGVTEFVREDYRGVSAEQFERLHEMGLSSSPLVIKLVRLDGEIRYVEGSAAPVVHDGETAVQVVLRDVTDRRRLQDEFRHAQKMESIGRLTGGIAHDLNNLLTPIMAYAHVGVSQVDEDHPVHTSLKEIQKAAQRASHLTHQLLSISRRQAVDPIAINMNELVLEMDRLFRRVIGEDIELVTLPSQQVPLVEMDPTQMEQVLMNLAVNARDAMPSGGRLVVRIETSEVTDNTADRRSLGPGEYVTVSVEDTGAGMTAQVRRQAFEPYFTTKQEGKGTGLGLSTSYGIANRSGGDIAIDSQLGVGTKVTVWLPRLADKGGASPPVSDSDVLPFGGETLIVVDDEPILRDVTASVLRRQG